MARDPRPTERSQGRLPRCPAQRFRGKSRTSCAVRRSPGAELVANEPVREGGRRGKLVTIQWPGARRMSASSGGSCRRSELDRPGRRVIARSRLPERRGCQGGPTNSGCVRGIGV